MYFYPRSPCGERPGRKTPPLHGQNFYPRSPCGERQLWSFSDFRIVTISIHALLAESDPIVRPLLERCQEFLSTLSLRRATRKNYESTNYIDHFYPRSPCGERLSRAKRHAMHIVFLSTLSLRRATMLSFGFFSHCNFYPRSPCGERPSVLQYTKRQKTYFYPRSPCGERPSQTCLTLYQSMISIHALLAESDAPRQWGFRLWGKFLSTLSLRRATLHCAANRFQGFDFYPRSPCGERPVGGAPLEAVKQYFYPRSPCGERHKSNGSRCTSPQFLSTLSLRRATAVAAVIRMWLLNFYPRSPCGERLKQGLKMYGLFVFLSTLSLRRATGY